MLATICGEIARSFNMSLKVSFGLPEIIGAFGCFGLVQANYIVGSILLSLGVFGVFCRYALEIQAKKESDQKIDNVVTSLKEAFLTPNVWANFSNDQKMH